MAKLLRTVFADEITVARLHKLSAITRIPKAVLIREGVDLMLDKHEEKLKAKHKKRRAITQKEGPKKLSTLL